MAAEELVGGGAPDGEVAAQGHRAAGDGDFRFDAGDGAGAGAALDLLDAVGVHPEAAAPAADVAAAGQDGVGAFNADVGLVEVQGVAGLHTAVAEALDVELVELGEAGRTYSQRRGRRR